MDLIIINDDTDNKKSLKCESELENNDTNLQTERNQQEFSLPLKIVTIFGLGMLVYFVVFNRSPCDSYFSKEDRTKLMLPEWHDNVSWNDVLFLQFRNRYGWMIDNIWTVESTDPQSSTQYCRIPTKYHAHTESRSRHVASVREKVQAGRRWAPDYNKFKYTLTCAAHIERLSDEIGFLNQGIRWYDRYNINETFGKCRIFPDDSKLYSRSQIDECFRRHFDVELKIGCRNETISKKYILYEIGLCFDLELKLKNCSNVGVPAQGFQYCKENFIYPANHFSLI